MKFLVFATLIAAAFAFPAEEHRSKRGVFGAPGVVVSGGTSIIKGPSGVIKADTGAIAAPGPAVYAAPAVVAAPALVAGPYLGYGGYGYGGYGYGGYGHGAGAVVVGPSPYGHPGFVKTGGHLFY